MVIDEEILEKGVTPEIVYRLISRHMQTGIRYGKLMDYYLGNHAICERRKYSSGAYNNKVLCNHAKYIVDMAMSYLVGNPITYTASDGYDIEPLKNSYDEQDIPSLDCAIEKDMAIFGHSFELVFVDEEVRVRSVKLSPMNSFVVYGTQVNETPLLGVHYYKKHDINNNVTGVCAVVCDKYKMYTYQNDADSFENMELIESEEHCFGRVPIIEYKNNDECQGDFEQMISLIDAYNTLQSDRVNDKEQFVDSFLFLSGIELDSEQAKKLLEERILMGYEGAEAKYLAKVMSENDIQVLRDAMKQDIHRFSMVPDLSDDSFGGNISGVAIKYKLMGFEQHIRNKERYFIKSLKKRFELYNEYMSKTNKMGYVPIHRIDIIFTRNLPENELEVSKMINNLKGIATSETLLSRLSFIGDPKEEAVLARRENIGVEV